MKVGVSGLEISNMQLETLGSQRTSKIEKAIRPVSLQRKLRAFLCAREEGSQLVEMAVVFPLLLILLTGMVSFGMALYSQQQLGLAAAGAAQAVGTGASLITGSSTPCSVVETTVTSGMTGWTASKFNYTLTITMNNAGTISTKTESWTGTSYPSDCGTTALTDLDSTSAEFEPVVVTVSYPYSWFPIFTWSKYGSTFVPSGSLSVSETAMIQ